MKRLLREITQITGLNLPRLGAFILAFRLAAGLALWKLTGLLLQLSLQSAGYSYLTMNNVLQVLLNPVSICSIAAAAVFLSICLTIELAALITNYQAAVYSRKAGLGSIARESLLRTWDQLRKGNWRLFALALASYLMMNSYVLLRLFSRIRPINFVMEELFHAAAGRLFFVLLVVGLALIGIPTMMVFFTCMVEQKNFPDGLRRSRELVKGRWPEAVLLLLILNGLVLAGMALLHIILFFVSAVVAVLFEDGYRAAAVLLSAGGRIEGTLLFGGSTLATLVDFGALTVLYCHFSRRADMEKQWDFSALPQVKAGWRAGGIVLGIGLVLSGALTFYLSRNGLQMATSLLGETEITAHRGSSLRAPENTLAALEAAVEDMADFCEIDVQSTRDGKLVVCHDLNLKRIAGIDRKLGDMTWDEVKSLDVGSRVNPEFAGIGIPPLEDVLEAAKGRIRLNIELKNVGSHTEIPEQTAALILDHGMENDCVVTSVSLKYLERVKEYSQEIMTGYILPAAYGKYYENPALDFISIRSSFVSPGLVERLHESGKGVHAWTVNQPGEMERLRQMGVDNIITDDPAKARQVLYGEEGAVSLLEYLKLVLR